MEPDVVVSDAPPGAEATATPEVAATPATPEPAQPDTAAAEAPPADGLTDSEMDTLANELYPTASPAPATSDGQPPAPAPNADAGQPPAQAFTPESMASMVAQASAQAVAQTLQALGIAPKAEEVAPTGPLTLDDDDWDGFGNDREATQRLLGKYESHLNDRHTEFVEGFKSEIADNFVPAVNERLLEGYKALEQKLDQSVERRFALAMAPYRDPVALRYQKHLDRALDAELAANPQLTVTQAMDAAVGKFKDAYGRRAPQLIDARNGGSPLNSAGVGTLGGGQDQSGLTADEIERRKRSW